MFTSLTWTDLKFNTILYIISLSTLLQAPPLRSILNWTLLRDKRALSSFGYAHRNRRVQSSRKWKTVTTDHELRNKQFLSNCPSSVFNKVFCTAWITEVSYIEGLQWVSRLVKLTLLSSLQRCNLKNPPPCPDDLTKVREGSNSHSICMWKNHVQVICINF